jgi:hypothetical protein
MALSARCWGTVHEIRPYGPQSRLRSAVHPSARRVAAIPLSCMAGEYGQADGIAPNISTFC